MVKMKSAVLLLLLNEGVSSYHQHKNLLIQLDSFPIFKQWGLESNGFDTKDQKESTKSKNNLSQENEE